MKIKINNDSVYYDGYLNSNLELLMEMVKLKWDGLGYICGYEGDGKSFITAQVAYRVDSTYCLERCVFTPKQFLKAIDEAKPEQAIVFDEAHTAFSNANRFDNINRIVLSKLTMIRKKRLYIFIVAPTFFDIQKYLVIHRSRFMIHVYAHGKQRGFFRFFNREVKHKLYIKGKPMEDMYAIKPVFTGRFTGFFPLDEEDYEEKKDIATKEFDKKAKNPTKITQALATLAQDKIIVWLSEHHLLKAGGLKQLAADFHFMSYVGFTGRLYRSKSKSLDFKESEAESAT